MHLVNIYHNSFRYRGGRYKIEYDCCGSHGRRYISKAEKVELLKQYKENLTNEIKGVEERINDLGKED